MGEKVDKNINIKLGGMTCANCALKIENKLKNLEGVNSAVVNFANEEATVDFDATKTGYNTFNEAIRDLGYKASLAKIDIKIIDEVSKDKFERFISSVREIEGMGLKVTPTEVAVPQSDVVVLAVPDALISRISETPL